MSVQAGIWNFDGRPVDTELIARFNDSIKQGGPDGESCYSDGPIALLFRPFHTTIESHHEAQPCITHRGFVLTWDGRMDNRDELMACLQLNTEKARTDVSIVAAAFDRWETDCFQRIVGDWAISIWMPDQRTLVFAVDYMAICHIFYYLKKDCIWWSTDLASLVLLSGTRFQIDEEYIAGYFAHDADAHLTPYREIREVPPGQLVRVRNGISSIERYWRFDPNSRIRYKNDAGYEEHFRHVFRQSVRRRLRSEGPVLAELSGGLDSSSVVCMADDILAEEGAQTPRLDTLSYYDKTEARGDDWIYFPKIEKKRGKVGVHLDGSHSGSLFDSLEFADFAPLPGSLGSGRQLDFARASLVRNGGYKVVLSGLGGDEFMGGIPNPSTYLADLILQFKFITLFQQLAAWSLAKRRPWIQLLWQASVELFAPSLRQYFVKEAAVEQWIEHNFARRNKLAVRLLDVDEHFGLWLPSRRSFIGGVLAMSNKLAKLAPPARALEAKRYPYLDQELLEFMLSIPASQRIRPGQRRSLMRRSLVGLVPQEILDRRTKQFGARTPILALEKHFPKLQIAFAAPIISTLGYVNHARFLERIHAAVNGKEIHISRMIRTISLEFWLRDLVSRQLLDLAPLQQFPTAAVPREAAA